MDYNFSLEFKDTTNLVFDTLWDANSDLSTNYQIPLGNNTLTATFDPTTPMVSTTYYYAKYVSKPITIIFNPLRYEAQPEGYTAVVGGKTVKVEGTEQGTSVAFKFSNQDTSMDLKIGAIIGPSHYNGTYTFNNGGQTLKIGDVLRANRGTTITLTPSLDISVPSTPTKETVIVNVGTNKSAKGKITIASSVGSQAQSYDFEMDTSSTGTTQSYKAEFEYV